MSVRPGPRFLDAMRRFGDQSQGGWEQGQHVLVSGSTGSGKTHLARHIAEARIRNGGFVVVFVCKLREDATVTREYKGWTRWEKMKRTPSPNENRVLLWPDTKGLTLAEAKIMQRKVFEDAFDIISQVGRWTIVVDEGLYVCNPSYLGLANELGMMHALGRSSKVSIVTLTQRPSHLPLILYSSASHAFMGRNRERTDRKRLAELGGTESGSALQQRIDSLGRHDFMWVPVAPEWPPEVVNLRV